MADEPDDKGRGASEDAPPSEAKATVGAVDPAIPSEADKEPPTRASALDLHPHLVYPDDGPVSAMVRKIDNFVGKAEQIVLVAIFATIVVIGSAHALLERIAHIRLEFAGDIIRSGTFAIALLGGAFATHQAKHLSMDLLSRKFSPRGRLFLKLILSVFMIFVLVLLIRSGYAQVENERQFAAEDKFLSRVRIAFLIPIGGAIMIFHTVLHMIIDADYIARHKTPPERMRSGH